MREDFGRIFGKIYFHAAPVGSFLKERALNKARKIKTRCFSS